MTATTPARVEVTTRSMVCITGVPRVLGDYEYVVLGQGRFRRAVQVGDHLPVDHPLVAAWPDSFGPSGEVADTLVVRRLTEEAEEQQRLLHVSLASHNARKLTPCCLRCGAESKESVVVLDQPQALEFNAELSGLDDGDHAGRYRVEAKYAAMGRAWQDQQYAAAAAEQAWRAEHAECPEGTPPLPSPEIPEQPPLTWRLSTVRTRG
jgi:hypothetical protein